MVANRTIVWVTRDVRSKKGESRDLIVNEIGRAKGPVFGSRVFSVWKSGGTLCHTKRDIFM